MYNYINGNKNVITVRLVKRRKSGLTVLPCIALKVQDYVTQDEIQATPNETITDKATAEIIQLWAICCYYPKLAQQPGKHTTVGGLLKEPGHTGVILQDITADPGDTHPPET